MTDAADRSFDSFVEGEGASFEHTVTERDVALFAELSGDHNPLHVDDAYAATTAFERRVVHGMFLGALVSRLIGMHLPGRCALLMKESLEFRKPVFIGDQLVISGTLMHMSTATYVLTIAISISRADEEVVRGEVHARVI